MDDNTTDICINNKKKAHQWIYLPHRLGYTIAKCQFCCEVRRVNQKPYSIFIVGYPAEHPHEISSCFSMLTYGLTKAFKKLPYVTVNTENVIKDYNPLQKYFSTTLPRYDLTKVPPVDFIIAINYSAFFNQQGTVEYLRTKCKKFVSFLEVPVTADFCFVLRTAIYKIPLTHQKLLPPIYLPEFTHNIPKEPNSILLDHLCLYWIANPRNEWSQKIWEWLSDLKDKYKIYCLVDADRTDAFGNPHQVQMKLLPKFITPIFATNYVDYMNKTSKMENFIVTHHGSYNFSVVDMASRGTRVFAPTTFVPKENVTTFKLRTFNTKQDLLTLIQQPIDRAFHDNQINSCISIDKVAETMDGEFQKWLG